jgi:putative ABC transport system substrate-binding protein
LTRLALILLVVIASAAEAQSARKLPVVAVLSTGSPAQSAPTVEAFRQGLRELGYVEGQSIAIELRWAERPEHLPDLAAEIVKGKVDVIVTQGTPAAQAARKATSTIPIVMATSGDPVAIGLVASLAKPGGNVTGNSILGPDVIGKRLALVKELVPGLSRIAVLANPANPMHPFHVKEAEGAAKRIGVALQSLEARGPEDFERVLQAATAARAGALVAFGDPVLTAHRAQLASAAIKHRVPAVYELSGFAEAGGLATYGPSLPGMFRRAAVYVDKILKGARPAELPIEQPSTFELVINLKTARTLGLAIPHAVLVRADRVID